MEARNGEKRIYVRKSPGEGTDSTVARYEYPKRRGRENREVSFFSCVRTSNLREIMNEYCLDHLPASNLARLPELVVALIHKSASLQRRPDIKQFQIRSDQIRSDTFGE